MRIALDVMGGDHGCAVVIEGARLALEAIPGITEIHLVGNSPQIQAALAKRHSLSHPMGEGQGEGDRIDPRLRILHATEVLTMEDSPLEGVRKKKDCSMVRAIELVRDGKADAVISPGNTGGLVAGSTFRLRRLEGVERPAIATLMPSRTQQYILIDAGANHECKPLHLVQFAVMGSVYSREILGREKPRVGILSNGTEESKGTELTRDSARLCQHLNLNFIGYIEGHDLFADRVDVVVTDGFVGNIVLKTCESMGKAILTTLKEGLTATPVRKFGAWLARGAFTGLKRRMDPDLYGGAPLLGLHGNVIKAHGSAREKAIMNAIRVAAETVQHHLNEIMAREIADANQRLEVISHQSSVINNPAAA